MYKMKILIACEESQRVCIEFRKLGHEAYSCDIQDESGGFPQWHIKRNALDEAYTGKYDMLIAFPPCTYLSNAGARHLYPQGILNEERYKKGLEAKDFFMSMLNAPIKHIAVENPLSSKIYNLPAHSQVIQPYQFGEPYMKKTLLWLRKLPLLKHTKVLHQYIPYINTKNYLQGVRNPKERSKTFVGIAKAMATQWSNPKYIEQLSLFEHIS